MIAAAIGAADLDWEETILGSLCKRNGGLIQTGPFGSQLHASDYVGDGIPAVMPVNIGDNRIVEDNIARISEEDAERLSRHRLRPGDIVYSRRGDVERRAFVTERERGWLCGTGCLMVRVGKGAVNAQFISYWLGHPVIRGWIVRHAVGATMANLNTGILSDVPVLLPPLAIQHGIAATLGALDDKIESNRRLRIVARELGFTRFAEEVTQESFRCNLTSVTSSISRGVAPQYADDDPSSPMVVNQRCIRDGWVDTKAARRMRDRKVANEKIAIEGDILVNSTGIGTLGRVGLWHGRPTFVDGHVSAVKPNPTTYPPTVLAYALLQCQERIEGLATGSTGQTELSRERLGALEIELPEVVAARRLEDELIECEKRAAQTLDEDIKLRALRDTLLPELLSGRLRVPEVIEVAGAAV